MKNILKAITKLIVFGIFIVPVTLLIIEQTLLRINGIGHFLTYSILAWILSITRSIVGEDEYNKFVNSERLTFDVLSMEWENRFRPLD